MKKIITLFVFALVINVSISAQTASASVSEMLKAQVQTKVSMLRSYITNMAKKTNDLALRKDYKIDALNLFIAKGESYDDEGIHKEGVIMETTSLYRKKPLRRLMRDYFDGVINYKYSRVDIDSSQVYEIEVGDLMSLGNNQYVCTVCYEQIFVGYIDGRVSYTDRTRKNMKVYISAEETMDGIEYIIKLGDVIAKETRPNK